MNTAPETLDEMDTFAARSGEATRKGAQAFARLLQLAETRDSGQVPRVARFLAATYNGQETSDARALAGVAGFGELQ